MRENRLALVSKVVCELTDRGFSKGTWMEECYLARWFPATVGPLLNGMVCEYVTGTYANKTGTKLEPKEHARARRKAKKSEGIQEARRNTKIHKGRQRNTKGIRTEYQEVRGNAKKHKRIHM